MKKIKIFGQSFILILLLPFTLSCQSHLENNEIFIATWNVENLFDTEDDPFKNDSEFLPESKKQWTDDKLETKLTNLMRVINYMNDGCGPDILALQEVENINVVKRLLYKLNFRNYVLVYRESPDNRGIDVTLIYDRDIFNIVFADTIKVNLPEKQKTRHILYVVLNHKAKDKNLHIFVNHWPSRLGGQIKSEPNRIIAAKTLREKVDSLFLKDKNTNIIILGDFNDEPENTSISDILNAKKVDCNEENITSNELFNVAYKMYESGKGTYMYGSDWNMLDQIIISSSLIDKKDLDYLCDSFEIIQPEYMVQKGGNKIGAPIPTYSGNRYIGGFSDHFPVSAKFKFFEERK
ncbi:endonuclease/exonuclease/phosphatase family protein [Rosettibacter firmus]|uniref:endonuclease/exonuclease/phosphatase family protein n=1 Tax=Rosettibacter firmus TaxID=3111522 RepID=UPI00336BD93F